MSFSPPPWDCPQKPAACPSARTGRCWTLAWGCIHFICVHLLQSYLSRITTWLWLIAWRPDWGWTVCTLSPAPGRQSSSVSVSHLLFLSHLQFWLANVLRSPQPKIFFLEKIFVRIKIFYCCPHSVLNVSYTSHTLLVDENYIPLKAPNIISKFCVSPLIV